MSRLKNECRTLELFYMSLGISLVATGVVVACRKLHGPRIPMDEYKMKIARIAAMDDRICRNWLEGNIVAGKPIVFPPLEESIKHRYRLFYSMYKKFSRAQLDIEMAKFKERLESSKTYSDEDPVNLTVEFVKGE